MKNIFYILLITFGTHVNVFSQDTPLSPLNNPADKNLIKPETSEMNWFMLKDSLKIPIGKLQTEIQREKERIYIITTVKQEQSPVKWIDSTIVEALNFKPIYHSSYNQKRNMVLKFGKKITGYYFNKQTATKTQISEVSQESFFDSNFYPQLIRLLPLKNGYSNSISIFDYNPKVKIGVITATVRNTEETTIHFNGKKKQVWKVETTDDISDNQVLSTFYIDKTTRKLLKQEIDISGGKMIMELIVENKESNNKRGQTIKSGLWMSGGNNPFWIEVKNDQVFWLGMNQSTQEFSLGEQWCHVGHGTIKDSKIYLTWSDIPVGKDQLDGTIIIEIIDATTMRVIEDSGNFGKSEWTWKSEQKNFNNFLSNN